MDISLLLIQQVSYDQYSNVRGSVRLPLDTLLPISATSSTQPCKGFGINPAIPLLKTLYDGGDASFFAGIGTLTRPVNKNNYESATKTTLFAHNEMRAEIGFLDPHLRQKGTGMLGRFADVLNKNYEVTSFTVDTGFVTIEGGNRNAKKVSLDSITGFSKFNPSDRESDFIGSFAEKLNGKIQRGNNNVFSESWAEAVVSLLVNKGIKCCNVFSCLTFISF